MSKTEFKEGGGCTCDIAITVYDFPGASGESYTVRYPGHGVLGIVARSDTLDNDHTSI